MSQAIIRNHICPTGCLTKKTGNLRFILCILHVFYHVFYRILLLFGIKEKEIRKFIYNHTFPEYLISTVPHPCQMYRHTHRPRKRKIDHKQPLLLSPVVRLFTPPCYPPRIHGSTTNKSLNSNVGEPDVRRLARCFFFILNFMF